MRQNNISTFATAVVLAVLSLGIVKPTFATIVMFGFEGTLVQVGGPNGLAVDDPFTGTFSYTLGQTGTNVPLIDPGKMTQYDLDTFSFTILGQIVSSTGGKIRITNNNLVFPGVSWDRVDLDPGPDAGATVIGSINGFPPSDFLLSLVNIRGMPFSDTSLPEMLDLADFPNLRRVDVLFYSSGGGAVIGEITSLYVVPLPSSFWLLISGFGGLAFFRAKKQIGLDAGYLCFWKIKRSRFN